MILPLLPRATIFKFVMKFGLTALSICLLIYAWYLEPLFWQPFTIDAAIAVGIFAAVRAIHVGRTLLWLSALIEVAVLLIIGSWVFRNNPYVTSIFKDIGLGVLLFIGLETYIAKRLNKLEQGVEEEDYESFETHLFFSSDSWDAQGVYRDDRRFITSPVAQAAGWNVTYYAGDTYAYALVVRQEMWIRLWIRNDKPGLYGERSAYKKETSGFHGSAKQLVATECKIILGADVLEEVQQILASLRQ